MGQIKLSNDTLRLTLDPNAGCAITGLELKLGDQWRPVLRTGDDGAGSFLMVPWTNRIKDGRFAFAGQTHELTSNHPDGTAIHGVGRDHAWGIADRSPYSARCVFDSRLVDGVNFPFAFGAVLRVEIGEGAVEIELDVTNLGEDSMPCGVGHHPYFYRSLSGGDDELHVQATVGGRYPCEGQVPTGAMADDAASESLRAGGRIGNPDLDDVFGGFDGRAELLWEASGVRCVMECSEVFGHLVVFTPREAKVDASMSPAPPLPPLPWVCVEPVSMVNDGFNEKPGIEQSGVCVLETGETMRSSMRLAFSRV